MAIVRVPYPEALPVNTQDYVRQNNLIETGFLRANDPWPIVGGNIVKGAVFQLGGTVYLATANTAIGGAASNYVKLTPSGDGSTLTPTYVANLAGVSWNNTYNGYYDVGGNLYVFDERAAILAGEIAAANTYLGNTIQEFVDDALVTIAGYVARRIEDNGDITKTKIIEIGDWNMDNTNGVIIAHGIGANYKNIRVVSVIIRNDADTVYYPLNRFNSASDAVLGGVNAISTTDIYLDRKVGGLFDSVDFNSITYNRGWIFIEYVE